jgi:hypothetical protein
MSDKPRRETLKNGAHCVKRDEIAALRISKTPLVALVARRSGAVAVPMTIILTVSSSPEENHPDYGLAFIQGQPGSVIRWQLRVNTVSQRWIEGHLV